MRPGLVVIVGLFLMSPAMAASDVDVSRGQDVLVYGSCVPSLIAENKSAETIDYLEVDLALTLANGDKRILELQSAYREGILYPIEPGEKAVLRQHLDTSRVLGVACNHITSREVAHIICETSGGKACTAPVSVRP